MTNDINVLEVLESKPNGTKLWCVLFGKCFLDGIDINNIRPIRIGIEQGDTFKLTANAKLGGKYIDGDCLLYPSKDMRDWSRFAWKKGDILISSDGGAEVIFDKWYDDTYTSFYCKHYLNSEDENKIVYYEAFICTTERYAIEDKDKAQIYIGIIGERLGGKLNRETLEVEKAQPEFKDGDIVCISGMGYLAYGIVKSIDNSSKKLEYYVLNDMSTLKFEDWLSLEDKQIQPITETQQIILFDALAKRGKAWDAENKMIVNLKPRVELKPFDKVLVRDGKDEIWEPAFFFRNLSQFNGYNYQTVGGEWRVYCVPYIGNESLLGTTKDVEG